ncbi:MAG: arylesterase [Pseudomonadota bacterium]
MAGLLRSINALRYGAGRAVRKATLAIGLTIAALPAAADGVVIAALGDSLTQGYGLPVEDGLVPQLQTWLEKNGTEATLINAGVSGDTTAGGLARIGWTLGPDVDALMVALGANDILRGLDPAQAKSNLDGILTEAATRNLPVLLIGFKAPGNYGPSYQEAFDGMYPALAAKHGASLVDSFFAPLRAVDDGSFEARIRYMQPDGLHPSKDGVAVIVDHLGPSVAELARQITD